MVNQQWLCIPELSFNDVGSDCRVNKGSITVEFLEKEVVDSDGKLILQRAEFSHVAASKVRSIIGNRVMWSYLVDQLKSDQASGFT